MFLIRRIAALIILIPLLLAFGCGREDNEGPSERPTAVTATWPEWREVERLEMSVGRLEALAVPTVAAETSGRLVRIHRDAGAEVSVGDLLAELDAETQRIDVRSASAELRRLEALLENQQRQVVRLQNLAERQSVAREQLDEAETQVESLSAQLDEARSRLETAEFNLSRTRIESPVSGRIQRRLVSSGDFVSPGRELFELVAADALRAILPLPERLQDEISIGQRVRLSIPSRPDDRVEARVSEFRPMISGDARSIELIVELENPGSWRSGGSVTGRIVVEQREGLVIPPGALVRRPAGDVVYVLAGDDRAVEREVTVGLRHPEWIEISSGLKEDEAVVLDGAGFLSDGALLDLQDGDDGPADGGNS